MKKCILCESSFERAANKRKKSQDLVCDACNKTLDKKSSKAKQPESLEPHEVIQARVEALQKLSKELKDMIETNLESCAQTEDVLSSLPESVQPFLYTPMKSYKMAQFLLAIMQGELMDSIAQQDSSVRLENALKKALETEDYRKSATLLDKLNQQKAKKTT
jgi:protein-arginine kinase activator protein McsA